MPSSLVLSIFSLLLLQANHGQAAILSLSSSDVAPTHVASPPSGNTPTVSKDTSGNGNGGAKPESGGLVLHEDHPGDTMVHPGDVEERNIHALCVLSHLFARNDTSGANLQTPDYESLRTTTLAKRKLHGRFLHLTDLHPDEFYKSGSAVAQMCHRKTPKKKKGKGKKGKHLEDESDGNEDGDEHEEKEKEEKAGWFGVPFSDCDSPIALTNLTLDHLHKDWADNVDFVIWTGDSARHDNDNLIPRTPSAIYEMNRIIASKVWEAFPNVPIVPSIGNNDIWPHNVMSPGPNSILSEYSAIWRAFIPFSSYQVFQRGGYFATELVPDHLAAISLNTMYWYDANKAVGGCELHAENDPGNLQFDWLDVQLSRYRDRGMQVILAGHVPPTPGNYFPDCHFRYGQTAIRYQDTIVGHFFGHMNVDHFFWLDVHDLSMEPTQPLYRVMNNQLHQDLRDDITRLPRNLHADDYIVVNVGPSVLPAYLPSYRVFQYNITQYLGPKVSDHQSYTREQWETLDVLEVEEDDDDDDENDDDGDDGEEILHPPRRKRSIHSPTGVADHRLEWTTGKRKHGHRHPERPDCSLPENKEKYACRPWGPRHASPTSPSRNNTLWSLLGYAQYYLPDLGESTKKNPPRYRMEYLTFDIDALRPPNGTEAPGPKQLDGEMVKKRVHWVPPVPKHLLPKSLREGNRTKSKFAPYQMEDLTIPSWIGFARKLGKSRRLWKQFIGFMYMGEDVADGFDEVDPEDGFDEVDPEDGFEEVLMGERQMVLPAKQ